ncbi:hypothetical protein N8I71_05610 [Roseibacterium sp. SDUM158016]|uniref:hypothetical protein n=1 Tax=Roseicyclus sediminis TaxID=2980997 RepID=UPI0021D1BB25|nr:hypothetical protein [Roseibacterium sp. SDUM158016]MCU4652296.1 hypothetical protein [Roseibacterium sp. SDUM158016]
MTGITRDDVRAAVASGTLSEAQAASLIVLSEKRAGVRAHLSGLDEPFELFKGFNEIFIVVGLTILYLGYAGITGITVFGTTSGYILGMLYAVIGMGAVVALARYFTLTRRMVAPSIALSMGFGLLAFQFGLSVSAALDLNTPQSMTAGAGMSAALLCVFYAMFRVPFTVALIAVSVFLTAFGLATLGGTFPDDIRDVFLLSAGGPFAIVTIVLGSVCLVVAMAFDMSDPHRVTRRAASGFWLHVIAAPAIVNTIALTLFEANTIPALTLLAAFIALMAVVAVVIDRRSFLVSGVGYVVALAVTVAEGQAFFIILMLGAGLVLLGAQWEALRRVVMRRLPAFPGKDRLPPYDLLTRETSA